VRGLLWPAVHLLLLQAAFSPAMLYSHACMPALFCCLYACRISLSLQAPFLYRSSCFYAKTALVQDLLHLPYTFFPLPCTTHPLPSTYLPPPYLCPHYHTYTCHTSSACLPYGAAFLFWSPLPISCAPVRRLLGDRSHYARPV